MPFSRELISAAIAIATGLVVALIVQGAGVLNGRRQRKASTKKIRDILREFENDLRSFEVPEDGRITREEGQFAFWQAHLETMRMAVSAHSPFLRQEDFMAIMMVVDGKARVTRMFAEFKRMPGVELYDQYFEQLRGIDWLKLEGSKSR